MSDITSAIFERFRWVEGHADVWRLFSDPTLFPALVSALAEPFRDSSVTKVVGIEARGFILGSAVATSLQVGFVAIRKDGGLLPGEKLERVTSFDYRGREIKLLLQRNALVPVDRVLLVDDWVETGSQAEAARTFIEESGATFVGTSVVVDQLDAPARAQLDRFNALIHREALGDDG